MDISLSVGFLCRKGAVGFARADCIFWGFEEPLVKGGRCPPRWRMATGQWLATTYVAEGSVQIPVLGGAFELSDIYTGVVFDEGRPIVSG